MARWYLLNGNGTFQDVFRALKDNLVGSWNLVAMREM